MYAIIETCGKQYKVVEGETIFCEKLNTEVGKKVIFNKIILVSDGSKVQIGNPYVKDVVVEGKILAHVKGKKIIVFRMKAKKNERKKQGHRQPYTKVEITKIKTDTLKVEKEGTKTEKPITKKPITKKEATIKVATTKKTATKNVGTTKKSTKTTTTKATTKKSQQKKK